MSDVNLSYSGIGDMLCMPEMVAEMHRRAERIADNARAIAPVGPATDGTHYKDAFEVSSGVSTSMARSGFTDSGTKLTRRAEATVTNVSPHAAAVEFGNYRTRKQTIEAHHVLGRSLDAAKD